LFTIFKEPEMKITLLGAGNMGSAFVKQLTRAGHQVRLATRDATKAAALAAQFTGVTATSASAAAQGTDLIIVATAYGDAVAALQSLGDLTGRLIVDISNPLTADYMGLTIGHNTSAAEEIAQAIPGAVVVKAFNTVFAQVLSQGADFGNGQRVSVFYAGDNDQGKQTVRVLAESMGFATVDAGALKNARYLEPLAGLNVYLGYGAGLGTGIAPTWLHQG
jgi:8-hydroxy-5-deazaflavin:NADPH oxidoreductase